MVATAVFKSGSSFLKVKLTPEEEPPVDPPADRPTLTNATQSSITDTTATVSVTTDFSTGTLYCYVSTSSTPPTATDLKAGTGAVFADDQSISSIGAKNFSVTGLTISTVYYSHFLHNVVAGDSDIKTSSVWGTTGATTAHDHFNLYAPSAELAVSMRSDVIDHIDNPNTHLSKSGGSQPWTFDSVEDAACYEILNGESNVFVRGHLQLHPGVIGNNQLLPAPSPSYSDTAVMWNFEAKWSSEWQGDRATYSPGWNGNHKAFRIEETGNNWRNLQGTVSCSGTTAVTGVGTDFTVFFEAGDKLQFTTSGNPVRTIQSIESDTALTLTAVGPTVSNVAYRWGSGGDTRLYEFQAVYSKTTTSALLLPFIRTYQMDADPAATDNNPVRYDTGVYEDVMPGPDCGFDFSRSNISMADHLASAEDPYVFEAEVWYRISMIVEDLADTCQFTMIISDENTDETIVFAHPTLADTGYSMPRKSKINLMNEFRVLFDSSQKGTSVGSKKFWTRNHLILKSVIPHGGRPIP